jgi:hypothetical protein
MKAQASTCIPGSAVYRLTSDVEIEVSAERAEVLARWAQGLILQARANGLLVTPGTVPSLARSAQRVADNLCMERIPEVYVLGNPEPNAYAVWATDSGRSFIQVNAGLLRVCRGSELDCVLGHELAHIAFNHAAREGPTLETASTNRIEVMRYRRAQRAAEISCDRIGFLVTRSLATASRVIMKMASGLDDALLGPDSTSLLQQLEPEQDPSWSTQATHPSMPLRLWALLMFSRAEQFGGTMQLPQINDRIEARLDQEAGIELERAEKHAQSRCLFWIGTVLLHAAADEGRLQAMYARFGTDEVKRGLRFALCFPADALRKKVLDHLSVVVRGDFTQPEWVLREFEGIWRAGGSSLPRNEILTESLHLLSTAAGREAR